MIVFHRTLFQAIPLSLVSFLFSCGPHPDEQHPTYVGRERCVTCHEAEAILYHGSDHDRALVAEPAFTPAHVNMADLYRVQGREEDALDLLNRGFQIDPDDPVTNHALGLAYIRRGEQDSAMVYLGRSVRFGPEDPRNAYVYAVGLYSNGSADKAIGLVESSLRQHPFSRDLLELALLLERESGNESKALHFQGRLQALTPRVLGAGDH